MKDDGEEVGRCRRPSTQYHGGGYLEVCCMCDEHADASPREWNWKPIRKDEGFLDTWTGRRRNRARCQHVMTVAEHVAAFAAFMGGGS